MLIFSIALVVLMVLSLALVIVFRMTDSSYYKHMAQNTINEMQELIDAAEERERKSSELSRDV